MLSVRVLVKAAKNIPDPQKIANYIGPPGAVLSL